MSANSPVRIHRNLFTDYDDTLVCSCAGPLAIAGTDTSYPRHTIYPGMSEFVRQLVSTPAFGQSRTSHRTRTSQKRPCSSPTVYISTARPNLPGLRKDPRTIQRALRLRHQPTLLYGDSRVGAQWVASRLWDHTWGEQQSPLQSKRISSLNRSRRSRPSSAKGCHTFRQRIKRQMGHAKYESWLRAKGPNGPSVFMGDSGQGDIYAALEMLHHLSPYLSKYRRVRTQKASVQNTFTYRPPIFRAYIHLLDFPTDSFTRQLPHNYHIPSAARRHICVYRTTLEAAKDAHRHGLICTTGLERVQCAYRKAIRTTPCIFQATDTNTTQHHWWTFVPQPTKNVLGHLHPGQLEASALSKIPTTGSNESNESIVILRYPFRPPSRQMLSYASFERTGRLRYVKGGETTKDTNQPEPSTTGTHGKLYNIRPMLNRMVLGECLRVL